MVIFDYQMIILNYIILFYCKILLYFSSAYHNPIIILLFVFIQNYLISLRNQYNTSINFFFVLLLLLGNYLIMINKYNIYNI